MTHLLFLPLPVREGWGEGRLRFAMCSNVACAALTTLLVFLLTPLHSNIADPKEDEGFTPIFDGKTLDGWKTIDPSYWSIQDGAITGIITKDHPLKDNRYLIWQGNENALGGQLADFELKLSSRLKG